MPIISALRDSGRRIGPGLHESLFQDKMKKGWGEGSTCKVIVVQEQRPKFNLPDPPMLKKLVQWCVSGILELERKTERPFELTDGIGEFWVQ